MMIGIDVSIVQFGSASRTSEMQTLFDHATATGMAKAADTADYTIGVVFDVAVEGYVDAVSIWKPAGSTMDASPREAGIWTFAGALVGSGSLPLASEPAAGNWVTVPLSARAVLSPGTVYVAGISVPNGGYSAQAGGLNAEITSGDLTAWATGDVPGNGRYRTGSTFGMPDGGSSGVNYWVDIQFFPT